MCCLCELHAHDVVHLYRFPCMLVSRFADRYWRLKFLQGSFEKEKDITLHIWLRAFLLHRLHVKGFFFVESAASAHPEVSGVMMHSRESLAVQRTNLYEFIPAAPSSWISRLYSAFLEANRVGQVTHALRKMAFGY